MNIRCCSDTTFGPVLKQRVYGSARLAYYKTCSCGKDQIVIDQNNKGLVYAGLE